MFKLAELVESAKLKKHQEEGVNKTISSGGSVLLDWKPGAGKTLGSIAVFEKLKSKGKANKAIVVTPSTLKDNYHQNISRFSSSSDVVIGNSQEKKKLNHVYIDNIPSDKDYYIISNEMFRERPEYFLDKTKADTVILDEIQKYKDPESNNYKQMMSIRPKIKNMIGMTGTPISNHPRDIIPLLDIVTNKKHNLGSHKSFDKNFIEEKKKAFGPLGFLGIGPKSTEVSLKNQSKLKSEFNKYVHSYHEEDVDMPKKNIIDVSVPMSDQQSEVYNWVMHKHINPAVKLKVQYNLPVNKQEASNIFGALMQARQASNAIHLFDKTMTVSESAEKTPKVRKLLEDVEEHINKDPKNKAIIYSNFYNGGVDVVSAGLNNRKISHGVYVGSGQTSLKDRIKAVDDYLTGKNKVIVLNQAGAEGLNLPGTTGHFALDGHFNPAMLEQSEARGIRTGSPVPEVEVRRYKTVMPHTPIEKFIGRELEPLKIIKGYSTDEWVYETARRKKDLNDQVQQLLNQ